MPPKKGVTLKNMWHVLGECIMYVTYIKKKDEMHKKCDTPVCHVCDIYKGCDTLGNL